MSVSQAGGVDWFASSSLASTAMASGSIVTAVIALTTAAHDESTPSGSGPACSIASRSRSCPVDTIDLLPVMQVPDGQLLTRCVESTNFLPTNLTVYSIRFATQRRLMEAGGTVGCV